LPGLPVLVGVDGSAHSRAALAEAVAEAKRRGTALQVLISFEVPSAAWLAASGLPMLPNEQFAKEAQESAQAMVDEVVGDDRAAPVISIDATPWTPAHALVNRSRKVGLLVVGTRGRGGFRGMLLGSVSLQCVLHAHCPVMVVRSDESTTDTADETRHTHEATGP
jgi:nucleotide-binding universal stress UspA family protein